MLIFFFFLWLYLWHMEVLRLGGASASGLCHSHCNIGSEQICDLRHSLQQCQILNPLSKARDQTYILMETMSNSEPRATLQFQKLCL